MQDSVSNTPLIGPSAAAVPLNPGSASNAARSNAAPANVAGVPRDRSDAVCDTWETSDREGDGRQDWPTTVAKHGGTDAHEQRDMSNTEGASPVGGQLDLEM